MNCTLALAAIIAVGGLAGCAVQAESSQPPIITDLDGPYLGGAQSISLTATSLASGGETQVTQLASEEEDYSSPLELDISGVSERASSQRWFIPKGVTLSEGLRDWADEAGWELVWKSRVDYRIASGLGFGGTIESAVEDLIMLYSHSDKPLYADISPRQRLVVVSEDPRELGE